MIARPVNIGASTAVWPVGHEHEPLSIPQRRGTEVVEGAVDRGAEWFVRTSPFSNPDVQATKSTEAIRGQVQLQLIERQDWASIKEGCVQLRACPRHRL